MSDDPAIAFRAVEADDLDLLGRWMRQPHWRQWWGEPRVELGYIRDMIEGRDTTRPFLILLDGQPAGYIQYWFIGDHQNEDWIKDNPWLAELPGDAVGVDLSIGEGSMLSRGIGSSALRAFVERLRADGHRTIIIDPDPANRRAVRAYEKAGFRPVPHLIGRSGDNVLIMRYEEAADGEAATPSVRDGCRPTAQ